VQFSPVNNSSAGEKIMAKVYIEARSKGRQEGTFFEAGVEAVFGMRTGLFRGL
jgi:hypothetical protein